MAMNFNIDVVDHDSEEEGVWCVYPVLANCKVKIRRNNCKLADKFIKSKDSRKILRLNKPKALTELHMRQLSDVIIADWEGIVDNDTNEEIPYSVEIARQLVDIKDFAEWVHARSQDLSIFLNSNAVLDVGLIDEDDEDDDDTDDMVEQLKK